MKRNKHKELVDPDRLKKLIEETPELFDNVSYVFNQPFVIDGHKLAARISSNSEQDLNLIMETI